MAHLASPYQRSNPRNFLHRSCGRKVVHPTEEIAEAARRLTEAGTGDGPLHSYRCDFCAGWHVGHVGHVAPKWPAIALRAFPSDADGDRRDRNRRRRAQRRGRRQRWLD